MPETYSLYTYEPGSLRIFGSRSSRAKYNSIEEAIKEYNAYLNKLKRVYKKDVFVDKQVLVVRYTDTWKSEIVGIIKNGILKEV